MNKVVLMGRLTRDPEIRYSNQGDQQLAIARFTLAVDRRMSRNAQNNSGQQTADFISCTTFRQTAEFIERYCKQGTKLVIEGRIQTGSYTNKDGQKVYTTDVIVENAEFAESKKVADANGTATNGGGNTPAYNSTNNGGGNYQNRGNNGGRQGGYNGGGYGNGGNYQNGGNQRSSGDGFVNIPDGVEDEELPFN